MENQSIVLSNSVQFDLLAGRLRTVRSLSAGRRFASDVSSWRKRQSCCTYIHSEVVVAVDALRTLCVVFEIAEMAWQCASEWWAGLPWLVVIVSSQWGGRRERASLRAEDG